MCLKVLQYIDTMLNYESSEPLSLLRLMGVLPPSLHRESIEYRDPAFLSNDIGLMIMMCYMVKMYRKSCHKTFDINSSNVVDEWHPHKCSNLLS